MVIFSIHKLTKYYNPLVKLPWNELKYQPAISVEEISGFLNSGEMKKPKASYDPFKPESRDQHLNRICWFISFPKPIILELNFNLPWPIIDGNHRLCAAIYNNEEDICGNWEGPIEKARLIFA